MPQVCVLYNLQDIFIYAVSFDTPALRMLGMENRILPVFANEEIETQKLKKNCLETYSQLVLSPGFRPRPCVSTTRVYFLSPLPMI